MKGTLPDSAIAHQSTIFGGGSELDRDGPIGVIYMGTENPPDENGDPTGFNLTVENVHFDHFQTAGICVEASKETVEIKNCVFSNPLVIFGWDLGHGILAANAPRHGWDEGEPGYKAVYLNGQFSITDCSFYMENSGVNVNAIRMDASDSLASFTATGNYIFARDELKWSSAGISCLSLSNATMYIQDNPWIQASEAGIYIATHVLQESPGPAIIMGNNIVVDGNLFADSWPAGIGYHKSENEEETRIEGNRVVINGYAGTGISTYQSSNCIVQDNRIMTCKPISLETGDEENPIWEFGPLCRFGISADGETWWEEFGITSDNTIKNNILTGIDGFVLNEQEEIEEGAEVPGNFEIGAMVRDTDRCSFEDNDFSKAICHNISPAMDPFFANLKVNIAAQLVVGPGATNCVFTGNKFGEVRTGYEPIEFPGFPDLSQGLLSGPTVHVGQSWYHVYVVGYVNENPIFGNRFGPEKDGESSPSLRNDYSGTCLSGWKANLVSPAGVELIDSGCILSWFGTQKNTFNETGFPVIDGVLTTACQQILNLGAANDVLVENKNVNCTKIQDTSLLRQYFSEYKLPGASIVKHEYRAWLSEKGIPGLLHGIYPHWPKYPAEPEE